MTCIHGYENPPCVECAEDERLRTLLSRCRKVLEQLEWCGWSLQGNNIGVERCPECGRSNYEGHGVTCELKDLLRELPQ